MRANWKAPADVKADFGTASILKEGRVVFNIGGNKYRLVVWINYPYGVILIKPIRTEQDYQAALAEVESLMTAEYGTPEGDRLDVLATLVEAYEAKHFPMDLPSPIDAIKFSMEQKGLTAKDLEPMIGRLNRVDEILNEKRPLTLAMIQRLHSGLAIPAEVLIRQRQEREVA